MSRISGATSKKVIRNSTTLNELFRQWLVGYAREEGLVGELEGLLDRARYAVAGGKIDRDELNER